MSRTVLLILWLACVAGSIQAQRDEKMSWRKHFKLAEKLYEKAQYADAAWHYRAAFKEKTRRKELAYKAGECYFIIRDYHNAAEMWQHVKDQEKLYPLIGLKYARMLKQDGRYEEAIEAFGSFLERYSGADKAVITDIVQTEIKGCELALEWKARGPDPQIEIAHMGEPVNTPETEFAPLPVSDDVLYFSSTMGTRAEIYRTQKVNGRWTKPVVPQSFPEVRDDHYCNGTLSPDQKRFYFTICKSVESWGGLTTRCEIYVTQRVGNAWSTPERLRDYINQPDATTTHPCVVHDGNTEILYFASNREGGKGGMDIWYTTRDLRSNDIDFSYPVNAGSDINTMGDEITPWYDVRSGQLYFASNGHVTLGGLDMYRASGAKSHWSAPENLGLPLNSSADDFFYIETPSGKGGFFVSNRTFDLEKITTTHEDIFSFTRRIEVELVLKGEVRDKNTEERLRGSVVRLYLLHGDGTRKLIASHTSENGYYRFELEPEQHYRLEVELDGYLPASYEFSTEDYVDRSEYGAPIYLEALEAIPDEPGSELPPAMDVHAHHPDEEVPAHPSSEEPTTNPPDSWPPPVQEERVRSSTSVSEHDSSEPSQTDADALPRIALGEDGTYIMRGRSKYDHYEVLTNAKRFPGTYYKIQLIAVKHYDPDHPRYKPIEEWGELETEYIIEKKLTRVLLARFFSLEEAEAVLEEVRKVPPFERAFIVKYEDGERIRRVR